MWGRVSDRYGRRPVLLTGLIGNTISSCLFGLSKSLWWAIGARALCGIMNGNSGVARSMVSEITDNTNKAKAFSIFGFCWGAGMIGNVLLLLWMMMMWSCANAYTLEQLVQHWAAISLSLSNNFQACLVIPCS